LIRVWRSFLGRLSASLAVSGRLPYWRYRLVLGQVPIACVDVLPVRETETGWEVGLIKRRDEHGRLRWAMVGGGVHRDETLAEAIERHVAITLGDGVTFELLGEEEHPHAVGQYFPSRRSGFGHDPRKHAIALSYRVRVSGPVVPMDEAAAFAWFARDALPPASDFGYGHELVVARLVAALPG
jgi:ADP-ribose pyrophosphatase YjhB (NUDIX family)